jgi:hypothetical protein
VSTTRRSRRHGEPRLPHRLREGFGKPGDRIIITAGVPLRTPGATNMLRIAYVGTGAEEGRR